MSTIVNKGSEASECDPGQPHTTPNTRRKESKPSEWVVTAADATGDTQSTEIKQISNRVQGIRHASDGSRVNLGIIMGEFTSSCRH